MVERSSEITALLASLRLALACAPLTLAATGCTSGASAPESGTTAASPSASSTTTTGVAEPPVPQPPVISPPEERLPSCPSGEWCGPAEIARALQGQAPEGAPTHADCPSALAGSDAPDDATRAEWGDAIDDLPVNSAMTARLDVEATKAAREAGEADHCCYDWMEMCPGGRPLLDHGQPQLAPLRPGARWTAALAKLDRGLIARLDPDARAAVAAAWLADARMEHSSIASFARAQVELIGVDAPAGLVEAYTRAAADERRHARICFGLAAAYGGPAVEPGPLPELTARAGGLVQVAVDTFVEGCVGETVASACLRRAAAEAHDPALASALTRMADDEGDHAALAWQTLAWAFTQGGAPVRAAIVAIAEHLSPLSSRFDLEPDQATIVPGHGRLTPTAQARVRREAWAGVITPLLGDITRA